MFDRLWPINRSIAGPGLLPGETDDLDELEANQDSPE
jgi:hypothetical protein